MHCIYSCASSHRMKWAECFYPLVHLVKRPPIWSKGKRAMMTKNVQEETKEPDEEASSSITLLPSIQPSHDSNAY